MYFKQTKLGKTRLWRCRKLILLPQHLETLTMVGFLNGLTTLKVTRDAGSFSVMDCCHITGELHPCN